MQEYACLLMAVAPSAREEPELTAFERRISHHRCIKGCMPK